MVCWRPLQPSFSAVRCARVRTVWTLRPESWAISVGVNTVRTRRAGSSRAHRSLLHSGARVPPKARGSARPARVQSIEAIAHTASVFESSLNLATPCISRFATTLRQESSPDRHSNIAHRRQGQEEMWSPYYIPLHSLRCKAVRMWSCQIPFSCKYSRA